MQRSSYSLVSVKLFICLINMLINRKQLPPNGCSKLPASNSGKINTNFFEFKAGSSEIVHVHYVVLQAVHTESSEIGHRL